MMRTEFTTWDIINKLHIPRGRLREWMKEGFIRSSVQNAKGAGTKALFDRLDIYAIVMFKHLVQIHKVSRREAAKIVKQWSDSLHYLQETLGSKLFDDFFAIYSNFRVLRMEGELIVGPVVVADTFPGFSENTELKKRLDSALDEPTRNKFFNACEKLRSALDRESQSLNKYTSTVPEEEYDSIMTINFRKIRAEAERVFD